MRLSEFKMSLGQHPGATLRFKLPDECHIPEHAHVTEVARIDKRFIDCGGSYREECFCRLQTWVADDVQHRLTAGRLLAILEKARELLGPEDLEIDVEHEFGVITQFPVWKISRTEESLVIQLILRHTACLAEDQCLRPAENQVIQFKPFRK